MRQIVLDTETTGLNAKLGDRVIEIACVEMINRRLTGKHFHCYVNPEREIDEGALKVHGITLEFLADKPKFQDVAQSFVEYLDGAELIIHNAAFDLDFLNAFFGIEAQSIGVLDIDSRQPARRGDGVGAAQ